MGTGRQWRAWGRSWSVGALAAVLGVTLLTPAAAAAAEANSPPVAAPDKASAQSGQTIRVAPLANDSDPDPGDVLSLVSVAVVDPASGTAEVQGTDVVVTVAPAFTGALRARYVVSDGAAQAEGLITVQVTRPNAPPVASPDAASVRSGGEVRLDPRANDSDPDGDPLTITKVSVRNPEAGTARLDGQAVVIRASATFVGTLTARYTLSDGRGGTDRSRITVTVVAAPVPNRPPVAVDDRVTVKAGRTHRIPVLANDSDPDGNRIRLVTVKKVTSTTGVSVRRAGSKVRFRAEASYAGSVRVRYRIEDSRGARDWGVLRVTVKAKRPSKLAVEQALLRLGLPGGTVDGRYEAGTRRAVCAWRTIVGRTAHRGLPTRSESRAIVAARGLPRARGVMVNGVTISVTCQAAFWVGSDRSYRRVMKVSTGKAGYRTRTGTFRVFRSFSTWRYSTIYPEARMYKPMQFSGGQAMHGSATDLLVRDYPASHGCVRMLHRDVDALQAGGFGLGSLVRVIGRW